MAIREDVKGRILLTGLHQVEINSVEDILKALNFGSSIRQTDATAINAKSSRSHAVFSISLVQRRNKTQPSLVHEKRFSVPLEAMNGSENWVTIDSKLHFVDLAGSERLKNTGASGERAKEGISINAGLASLGKVISQLSSRHPGSHISYRDSKLTRLLQDSLGGNAITYMIACVTPAEFHLSETLNTVQYAQRARAIQSKPRIQQVSDDSDKQAVIDRLRAEVSFLRDQIRNSENGDRRGNTPPERVERQNEREIDLQNHLLDIQESYTALSQRHANLISEITKARDDEPSDTPILTEAIGNSAVERLKRSNSFAEAVEKVVLEYEKTIQSLETSLSKTRSSLSATESSLLEKETKCAYIETVNQQLQNRVQKMMDRESSTENYLRDLESKLDGHSFGEEKSSVVITELRKEIARIRENEASCEEYISTLEERLAETDQDMELMQREVDRLEHVVERQRSLGKLDNLLYEFDHIQQTEISPGERQTSKSLANGFPESKAELHHRETSPDLILQEAVSTAIPDSDDDDGKHPYAMSPEPPKPSRANGIGRNNTLAVPAVKFLEPTTVSRPESPRLSPAQSRFVADKVETLTQELFDLRVEHESTVNEYDMMSAKYEQALRTLAELQDAVDEARHPAAPLSFVTPVSTRPTSFLGDARVNELKDGGQLSSSRSLSSELSLVGDSTSPFEQPNAEALYKSLAEGSVPVQQDEALLREIEELKKTQLEREHGMATLNNQYSQLQELHLETLDVVEELKAEVQKAKLKGPNMPTTPLIRRKGSQTLMTIDRAHRSLASLRNIAAENLEDKPDTMQSFEMNINATMHELHQRSERVQALEAELSSVKKEMEGKMTMISGLARERSSLKSSSPMDISVVSSMHDQLVQAENQMRTMHENHAAREHGLVNEIESLKQSLKSQTEASKPAMPGIFPETPAVSEGNDVDEKQLGEPLAQSHEVARLQEEPTTLQRKHDAAMKSTQALEQKLIPAISKAKASLTSAGIMNQPRPSQDDDPVADSSAVARELEEERRLHIATLNDLNGQIDEHKASIAIHVERIVELELLYATARQEVEEGTLYKISTRAHLESHRDQILLLEHQLEEHKSSVEFHKYGLKSLHDSHARALEDVRSSIHAEAKANIDAQLKDQANDLEKQYREKEGLLLESIAAANQQLNFLIETHHNHESRNQSSHEQSAELTELVSSIRDKVHRADEEKALAKLRISELEAIILDMKTSHQQNLAELQRVSEEKDKATRLVDELEDQLSTTYDQQRATSNRLSILNSNRDQALQEANVAKVKLEEEIEIHRARVAQLEVRVGLIPLKIVIG